MRMWIGAIFVAIAGVHAIAQVSAIYTSETARGLVCAFLMGMAFVAGIQWIGEKEKKEEKDGK